MVPEITFGKHAVQISRMGLGLAALGRPGYITLTHGEDLHYDYSLSGMKQRAHKVMDQARTLGISFFDAAQSYGKAEHFLGSWLSTQNLAPEEVFVSSKWGYTYTADWQVEAAVHEVKDHSLPVLERQWRSSSERLSPFLNLYQVHSATFASKVLENASVLAKLVSLKGEGLLIGLSVSGAEQGSVILAALASEVEGVPVFDSVQATWNLLEPSAGEALRQAHEAGYGIIIKEALANGLLSPKNTDPAFSHQLSWLRELGKEHQVGIDAIALAIALEQPWVHSVLSGAATPDQVKSNVKAFDLPKLEITNEMISELSISSEKYWMTRKSLKWN